MAVAAVRGIIVLDGPDCTGKSTLAKRLVERYGGRYIHLTYRYPKHMFTYHTAALRRACRLSQRQLVVVDRLWLSEEIYAHAYRGGSPWPLEGRFVDRVLLKHAALNVMCLPRDRNPHVVIERHLRAKANRQEMYDDISKVVRRYMSVWDGDPKATANRSYVDHYIKGGGLKQRRDHVLYDMDLWPGRMLNEVCDLLIKDLEFWQRKQLRFCLDPDRWEPLGHYEVANTLMLGDDVNSKFRNLKWPFYEYGFSSKYITDALQLVNVDETKLMWANQQSLPMGVFRALTEKLQVIALGKNAEFFCRNAKVPCITVRHPQSARRFHHDTQMLYGQEIKDIVERRS